MSIFWYRLRSWHAATPTRALEGRTFCGRQVPGNAEWSTDLPGTREGKSCENCLRILAKRTGE
jgi:hypothetical protein